MIRSLTSISFVVLICLPLAAQDKLLPPGITKEQASQGWIALFDGETTYGWRTEGPVKVEDGYLVVGGDRAAMLTSSSVFLTNEVELHYRSTSNQFKFTLQNGGSSSTSTGTGISSGWDHVKQKNTFATKATPFILKTEPGTVVQIKSFTLLPTGGKSLFNGNDLTGWKEFSRQEVKVLCDQQR